MRKTVCVIGLGYVGLPLAVRCVEKGYATFGLDMDKRKVNLINQGKSPIEEKFLEENLPKFKFKATADEKVIKKADVVLICVPTPVDKMFFPDLGPVIKASKTVAKNIKNGTLVVLESTVNPGVSEEIVKPIFEKMGWKIGKDIFIAHCPERINPGDEKWNVTNIPRVIGSFDEIGLAKAKNFYESIVDAPIMPMKSIREAEAVKIMENSFRDINIAFVNELAKSFDKMNIDVTNVIRGASTKPFAFMAHWPGCGVGGHCIPVDPYYLIERAKENDFDHKFLRTARNINNSMPSYTVEILQDILNQIEMPLKGTPIGVLGISYKAGVADLRESPALKIIDLLKNYGAILNIYDPYVPGLSNARSIEEVLKKSKAIIITANHKEFENIPVQKFKDANVKVIVDGKNCLDKDEIKKLGIIYKGIGR